MQRLRWGYDSMKRSPSSPALSNTQRLLFKLLAVNISGFRLLGCVQWSRVILQGCRPPIKGTLWLLGWGGFELRDARSQAFPPRWARSLASCPLHPPPSSLPGLQRSDPYWISLPRPPVLMVVLVHHIPWTLCWVNNMSAKKQMIKQRSVERACRPRKKRLRTQKKNRRPWESHRAALFSLTLGWKSFLSVRRGTNQTNLLLFVWKGQGVTKTLLLLGAGLWSRLPQTAQGCLLQH